jgi:hypothetical protein
MQAQVLMNSALDLRDNFDLDGNLSLKEVALSLTKFLVWPRDVLGEESGSHLAQPATW